MTAALGWALALSGIAIGYWQYSWPGVVLAFSIIVFWLLMQFSRALRVMRLASGKPVGHVDNAVMFNARLRVGMRLMQIIVLTKSLGEPASKEPEVFVWRDGGGDAVRVELEGGRCVRWTLERAAASESSAVVADATPPSP